MIYTVTLNPAIDYVIHMDAVQIGQVNRARKEEIYFGGKGINVSMVLKELGVPSRALGFVAGFTGEAIEKGLQAREIETDFVHLKNGFSRINVKMKTGVETELNGQGPEISGEAMMQLLRKLDALQDGDTLILAGSIPSSMPSNSYETILAYLSGKKIRIIVDATNDLLLNTLKYHPFLIKPNHHELGELFGVQLTDVEKITFYAKRLQEMGAENVLVSMAEKGALLLDAGGTCHHSGVCEGSLKNAVGAGDSMLAGFLAGFLKRDYAYALKLGTAAGGATAFSDGLAQKAEILRLLEQLL